MKRKRFPPQIAKAHAVGAVVGKRDVTCTAQLTEEQAALLAQELVDKCQKLDFDPKVGLTREAVDASFEASDGQYTQPLCLTPAVRLIRLCMQKTVYC